MAQASSSAGGSASARPSEGAAGMPRANALRAFYGLAEESDGPAKAAAPVGAPPSPKPDTPASATSPDSSAFALPEALAAVLSDAGSPETGSREHAAALMHVQASLLREMRELDGARQSLVYNHHWQLVKGGETLRTMKARAEDLTPALDALQGSLSRAEALRKELAAALPATGFSAPSQ
ncbi:hypothetical protein FA09DRAFT_331722 [Tilletiopsis washingtonensis]|uniref:Uncharacterized protein n=1 Tax=Tilletiopsis washingtonensis TaxID=58919 RepID=A0A316Z2I9_9BASI|nr:hypothetical protein FA09DRAFT_331722 [Tilletiopsis washingtonensis]PWN95751.1 hypothetical protein FA09DRAFT_331722 [Tilletiopsis washingtonensis]